jgi:hypothetical protein
VLGIKPRQGPLSVSEIPGFDILAFIVLMIVSALFIYKASFKK